MYRYISGSMSVPHYLTNNAGPSATLVIDENNTPVYQVRGATGARARRSAPAHARCADGRFGIARSQGQADVTFSVFIPRSCVVPGRAPCPIMNYGHGLLGSQSQVRGAVVRARACACAG